METSEGQQTLCSHLIPTDMSKAFDSLHPLLLLSKLKAYGFQDGTIQLLDSYLCNRKYRIKICSHTSSSRTISRGCPRALPWVHWCGIYFKTIYPFLLNRACQCTQTTIRCSTLETIDLLLPWSLEKLRAMLLIGTTQTFWLEILKSITSWTLAIVKTKTASYTKYV